MLHSALGNTSIRADVSFGEHKTGGVAHALGAIIKGIRRFFGVSAIPGADIQECNRNATDTPRTLHGSGFMYTEKRLEV